MVLIAKFKYTDSVDINKVEEYNKNAVNNIFAIRINSK